MDVLNLSIGGPDYLDLPFVEKVRLTLAFSFKFGCLISWYVIDLFGFQFLYFVLCKFNVAYMFFCVPAYHAIDMLHTSAGL